MAAVYSIFTFDFNRLLAIFASHLWLIFNLRIFINARLDNNLRHHKIDLIYKRSIALDYFFKRKKYFYQIFE